jgi:hypothetical protein
MPAHIGEGGSSLLSSLTVTFLDRKEPWELAEGGGESLNWTQGSWVIGHSAHQHTEEFSR